MARALDEGLLEREAELATLRELTDGAAAADGAVALVEGPPGIGKSRLLAEALAVAVTAGAGTAMARGSELERDFAFGVVRQLFEPLLRADGGRARERAFTGAAALSGPLFEPLDPDDVSSGGEASQAALHGLYWLTVNLATDRPLVLAVDDAHWADAPSLRFVAYLVNRLAGLPVLLVVATRPPESGSGAELLDVIAAHPLTTTLHPAPLSPAAVDELSGTALGGAVDPAFAAACFEATKGNPLLLRELVATLTAEGIAPTADHAARVLDVAPPSVARSVARRLRRLPPEATAVAHATAVLGDGAALHDVARLAELDPATAGAAAQALRRSDILAPGRPAFVHPVVRAAVYAELSAPRRSDAHRAAAAVLADRGADEEEVALHVLVAEPRGDPWAVEVLRRAGRRALGQGAPDVAMTYLRRARSEPPPQADRADVLVELGTAELAAASLAGHTRLRQAIEASDDPRARARIALGLGRSLFSWGAITEAASVFEAALDGLDGRDPELAQRLEAQLLSACVPEPSLHTPAVEARLAELLAHRDEVSDPVLLAAMAITAAGRIEPARGGADLAERALADPHLSIGEDPATVAMAAIALMADDRLDEARRVWDAAVAAGHERGSIFHVGFAWTLRALVNIRAGAIQSAEADARAALDPQTTEWRMILPWVLPSLIDALVERGELDEASALLDHHGLGGELPELFPMIYLLGSTGRLRVAQQQVAEGVARLRECGRRMGAYRTRNPAVVPWRADLAVALAAAGRHDEAREVAGTEIALARAFGVPREHGMALRAAGLAEGGDAGIALLREAVAVLEGSPARLEHARALTDLGAALRRANQRAEAREPLRAGLDGAQRCGATALVHRAHEELVATGSRPRRLVLSGVDALTASERRVAEMAAEGHSNREIAQALFVTEKTVEGHLSRVYHKLDVRSRSLLPAALGDRPPRRADRPLELGHSR